MALENLDKEQIRSFIISGGDISIIDNAEFGMYLQDLKERDILIAGICAGVDVLKYLVYTKYIPSARRCLHADTSKRMG